MLDVLLVAYALHIAPQPTPPGVEGVVRSEVSGRAIAGASVVAPLSGATTLTDSLGRFALTGLSIGRQRIEAGAPGFRTRQLVVRVPASGTMRLEIDLAVRVQQLDPLDVAGRKAATVEQERARELFERRVVPGSLALSRSEISTMPSFAEADVLRRLQSMPGTVALNDLDAQLYVRGGAADQNLFLLDGMPIYGAHHAFGMSGAFNPDAVESIEFFRGGHSARHGGALSSVVEIEQSDDGPFASEGGISPLGLRLKQSGGFGSGSGQWMVAGRRSLIDVASGSRVPLAFHDVQARAVTRFRNGQFLRASAFTSSDRFGMFFGGGKGELRSRWSNYAGSLQWQLPKVAGWTTGVSAYSTQYRALMLVGAGDSATRTNNILFQHGIRMETERGILGSGVRAGVEVERADVRLTGSEEDGGYFLGEARRAVTRPAAYLEGDRRWGALRIAPGLRVTSGAPWNQGWLFEPRLGVRLAFNDDVSLTVGASRDHQSTSALRDARTVLPGPPLWYVHPENAPVSRSDALNMELTTWLGDNWNVTASVYQKRYEDVPRWNPAGTRDLSSLSFDDGRAEGAELIIRRFGERFSGWLGYDFGRVSLTDAKTGARYDAEYDRRHTLSAALAVRPLRKLVVSTQASVGSGTPFWPVVHDVYAFRFEPFVLWYGGMDISRPVPVWGDTPIRMPTYARFDVAVRRPFTVRRGIVEPYVSVQNVSARPNALYYHSETKYDAFGQPQPVLLRPVAAPFTILPTMGIDVRF